MAQDKNKILFSRTHRPVDWSIEQWQVALRREYAKVQNFRIKNVGRHPVLSEWTVMNPATRRTYRVAIRSERLGDNFCSCPDFTINTLGTCKHVEFILSRLHASRKYRTLLSAGASLPYSEIFLQYGPRRRVIFKPGSGATQPLKKSAWDYFDKENILREDAFGRLGMFLQEAKRLGHEVRCYDDALSFIAEVQDAKYRREHLERKFSKGADSAGFEHLLKIPMYAYQHEGALFAAQAGRALIADDMGLGKTVQAIAAAEILAQEFGIQKALIICPVSLKHQWKNEIEKFCNRSVSVIEGLSHIRRDLYQSDTFFKIINYDVVHRDLDLIARLSPDLVILDEAQRIKNWKTRLAQSVKQIKSPYCLVLTGTPLENRLEELYSIVEFVDRYRLGPMFRFLERHQELDSENGKVVGYRNLKEIGQTLSPLLIRRRKSEVLKQLPERMEKNFFVPMTDEQKAIHEENREIVSRLVSKWNRQKFLSEVDQRRLMIALQYMRMACDSTYLIDQKTRFGKKVDELAVLLSEIFEQNNVKVVVFSQWERMTSLVAELLRRKSWLYVHFHGGVPGHKRKDLIRTFHDNPGCRVFLSTDAGGVGLNLQAASIVVNLDLPWNPAVLEQRIGRVHRLGQHKPVRVVNFISEASIEENMLSVLRFKKSLFAGVLDNGMDSVFIGKSRISKFMESVEELTGSANSSENDSLSAAIGTSLGQDTPIKQELKTENEVYRAICAAGVSLFKTLAGGLSGSVPTLEKDPGTGKSCLKLPLPDRQAIDTALPAVESLLVALKRYLGQK